MDKKRDIEPNEINSKDNSPRCFKCLTDIDPGSTVRVVKIDAGAEAKTRLSHLGITPNTPIKLECCAPFKGPVCVNVRGTTLCIGRGLAKQCVVEKISEDQSDYPKF